MRRVRTWELQQVGDWFVRNPAHPLYTVRLRCGHDGNLRKHTVIVRGDELEIKEPVYCPACADPAVAARTTGQTP